MPLLCLIRGKVCDVGEIIAVVVAEYRYVADDTAEVIGSRVGANARPALLGGGKGAGCDPASVSIGSNFSYHETFTAREIERAFGGRGGGSGPPRDRSPAGHPLPAWRTRRERLWRRWMRSSGEQVSDLSTPAPAPSRRGALCASSWAGILCWTKARS